MIDWETHTFEKPFKPGVSYEVVKFPDRIRKQAALCRREGPASCIVAYFVSEKHALAFADWLGGAA